MIEPLNNDETNKCAMEFMGKNILFFNGNVKCSDLPPEYCSMIT